MIPPGAGDSSPYAAVCPGSGRCSTTSINVMTSKRASAGNRSSDSAAIAIPLDAARPRRRPKARCRIFRLQRAVRAENHRIRSQHRARPVSSGRRAIMDLISWRSRRCASACHCREPAYTTAGTCSLRGSGGDRDSHDSQAATAIVPRSARQNPVRRKSLSAIDQRTAPARLRTWQADAHRRDLQLIRSIIALRPLTRACSMLAADPVIFCSHCRCNRKIRHQLRSPPRGGLRPGDCDRGGVAGAIAR